MATLCKVLDSLLTQVMYFSSLFPYVVLFCFLVRGLMLRGAVDGIAHMFTPKVREDKQIIMIIIAKLLLLSCSFKLIEH